MQVENRIKMIEASLRSAVERWAEATLRVEELESRVSTLERLLNAAARTNAGKDLKRAG